MLASRFVNTSPLVYLARENLLEFLREGALEVIVPQTVIRCIFDYYPHKKALYRLSRRLKKKLAGAIRNS